MLTTIYILFLLFLLSVSILCWIFTCMYDELALVSPFIFSTIMFLFSFGFPVYAHISDLSTIEYADKYIEMRQEAIIEINAQISQFNPKTQLLNADTPYASLITTKANFVNDITMEREKLLNAKQSIYKREKGFTKYATWLVN